VTVHRLYTSHARMGSGMEPGQYLWLLASLDGDEYRGVSGKIGKGRHTKLAHIWAGSLMAADLHMG
jgi:hypothetical protein